MTDPKQRFHSRLLSLLLVPVVAFAVTACDSNNSGMKKNQPPPNATFSVSKSQSTVSFDATASSDPDGGSIQSYSWSFGDNATGSGSTTSHTYGSPGSYDVTLEVVDDEGAQDDTTVSVSIAQNQFVVTDDITSNTTWESGNTYVLDGLVFVENGATLTIEPGTVIKGRRTGEISNNDGASALIVKRSSTINASGEADNPIIFTSTADDLSDPTDLGPSVRGLWGGLVVLGRAPTAEGQPTQVEGVTEQALFGGDQPGHSSGTLEYISIRHGGFSITGVSGDEINGLTLGGVGSGTTINHIEVFSNADDGIEWFGGTVHASHLVAAFCGDDAFDWDTGFRGTGQYWFAIQATDDAGRGGELDGFDSTTNENTEEFSDPVIANATLIGSGSSSGVGSNSPTLRIRNGGASEWYNSIFTAYPNTAVRIDTDDSADQRWAAGDIVIRNNVFFDYGAGSDIPAVVEGTTRDSTITADNAFMDPQLAGISRTSNSGLDPRPGASNLPTAEDKSSFENTSATPRDNYVGVDLGPIENTSYIGAFAPNGDLWTTGWTKLSQNGYMVQ